MKYLIVIEATKTGYSSYAPDVEGCVATGKTREGVERAMKGGLRLHIEGLKAEGLRVPRPSSSSAYLDVPA